MILIQNQQTNYRIRIAADASESIRTAACTLRELILRCTGAELEICTEEKPPYISIGRTEAFASLGVSADPAELNDDGFRLLFRGGNIFLCGGTERGTVYAANDFAERYLGVRFLTAEETYTPHTDTVEIEENDVEEIPDFPSRAFYAYEVKRNAHFAAGLRLISVSMDDAEAQKHGGGFLRDWNGNNMHAIESILPRAKYYALHPEWYASERPRTWLCLTNGLTDEDEDANDPNSCLSVFAENVLAMIRENPKATYFMLGHEDSSGNVYCQCERCRRSRERNGTVSGYLMVWINAIARRVEKWRLETCPEREIKLVSFAYLDTIIPPVYVQNEDGINKPYIFLEREYWAPLRVRQGNIIPINPKVVPEKNVVIYCAPIGTCYLHEMTDMRCDWNQYFRFAIQGWKALGADIMIWYYGVNFSWHLWWLPNRRTMSSHLKFYSQFDPLYIMLQGAPREGGFYHAVLSAYLISKLMWNMSRDTDALTEEFNRLYFGEKSAAAVQAFIEKMERHYAELDRKYDGTYHSDIGRNFPNSFLPENFPYAFLTDCIDDLEAAIEKETDAEIKTKLKRVVIHPLYMLAHNFHAYPNADTKYPDMLESYLHDTGILYTNEANKTPETLMKEVREKL